MHEQPQSTNKKRNIIYFVLNLKENNSDYSTRRINEGSCFSTLKTIICRKGTKWKETGQKVSEDA